MHSLVHSRLWLFFLLLLCIGGSGLVTSLRGVAWAVSTPHIWLSQRVAPPTASIQVDGGGFGNSETVSVDFDTSQLATVTTDTTGKFALRIMVPKSAQPGTHTVRATGQSSGLTAPTLFLVRTDWAQNGFGPYDTGNNPYENVLTPANVSNLVLDWSYATGIDNMGTSPAVVNGVVYAGFYFSNDTTDYGKVYALDAATGKLKWSFTTTGDITDTPAVVNGVVYIGSDDNNLYALDAATGTLKWSYYTGAGYLGASPVVVNGVVYVDNQNAGLFALDAVTGTLKWSYTTANLILSSSLAVANGLVYVSAVQDKLYALDAAMGTLKWSYPMSSYSIPAVVNGIVYIGANDNKLYALDALTGSFKWSYTTGYLIYASPAVANGIVYISSEDRTLYALDAMTGTLKWKDAPGVYFSNTAIANGVVYVSSGGSGSQDATLDALDAKTGRYKWSFPSPGYFIDAPIVANGVVYACAGNGTLYAFHLPGTIP